MPMAPRTSPPAQHRAATAPALRGPTRSSQPPHCAAETPSTTKNSVYIQPRLATRQLQVVVNSSPASEMFAQDGSGVPPIARDSGSQNTLKPYAMPMHRWMHNAAGGTSQRLNPAAAMMRSRSSRPTRIPASAPNVPCTVAMAVSPLWFNSSRAPAAQRIGGRIEMGLYENQADIYMKR